jgi:hypothetical protein
MDADKVAELHDLMIDNWRCVQFAKKGMSGLTEEELAAPRPTKALADFLHWRGVFEKAAERYATVYLEGVE